VGEGWIINVALFVISIYRPVVYMYPTLKKLKPAFLVYILSVIILKNRCFVISKNQ